MDDKDLFSYDNSGNLEETGEESFDLNSFSSHIEKEPVKGKKSRKKKKVLCWFLRCFLIIRQKFFMTG
mgnify:CR=1 FL=1